MVTVRQLECFIAVAEELHFRRAAERLRLAQPGVTRQIQELERQLGVRLLDRSQRRVQLTAAGAAFLEQGRRAVEQLRQAVEIARRTGRGELGRLTIASIGSAIHDVLPELLRDFGARYPAVEVTLREMSTPMQVEAIRRGEVDLGLLRLPADTSGLVERTVRVESMAVMVPRQHPLARLERIPLTALEDEPMIVFPAAPRPSWADIVIDACRQGGFEPRIVQQAIESAAVVSFVAAGIGIAVVPEGLRVLVRPEVAYRLVMPPAPTTRLALVRRRGEAAPTARAFLEILDARWPDPETHPAGG